jgi:uncharacterized circularly permuted ATP-grasp superfamily protein/uncharacterized alpha-E superfamily protein
VKNLELQPEQSMASPSLSDALAHLAKPAFAGHFDELRAVVSEGDDGSAQALAAHWGQFFDCLGAAGIGELSRKHQELARQVRDNGITYNVYAEQSGPQRPWAVDLLPFLITPTDWAQIEEGVLQRARLCEAIMADIYGEQSLLSKALIPAALVHGHPGYLRPMHGAINAIDGQHLQLVAFDVARDPNNGWAVVAQRTQAPSGLGYLLENRLLISAHFSAAFEQMQVARLIGAYQALIGALKTISPAGAQSHVALLTPGPYNETYFEHAYLARYLGITLVEGNDLTVRDQRVFLRTLNGLEPVHVLLKRLDDEFLDPLELRADSTLGVPGLLEAIRAGNVVVANAPGSGFLESPALLGFLPGMSEALLGETLKLPAMDTWWCGEPAAMALALPRLKESVIKPTYPRYGNRKRFETLLGRELSTEQLAQWASRIKSDPSAYTIQAYMPVSQTPVWHMPQGSVSKVSIEPRSAVLRVFALRDARNEWRVLPGGLARLAGDAVPDIASMQRGGSSADIWVLGAGATTAFSPKRPKAAVPQLFSAARRVVTSRAAENLFWFGRYTERAENTVRLARLCLEALNGEKPGSKEFWSWLDSLIREQGMIPEEVPSSASRRLFERTLIRHLEGVEGSTSVGFNLSAMQRAASVVRERLSIEQWNNISRTREEFASDCQLAVKQPDFSSTQALRGLFRASASLAGITGSQVDRMTRDSGWQLLSLGRHIERLGFLSECLEQAIAHQALSNLPEDDACFLGLLVLFDSTITFRAQYQQSREISALVELLVADSENPRSIAWVAQSLRHRFEKITKGHPGQESDLEPLKTLLPSDQDFAAQPVTACEDMGGLNRILERSRQAAWQVSDIASARYFSHIHAQDVSIGA